MVFTLICVIDTVTDSLKGHIENVASLDALVAKPRIINGNNDIVSILDCIFIVFTASLFNFCIIYYNIPHQIVHGQYAPYTKKITVQPCAFISCRIVHIG